MSFAAEVKKELCRETLSRPCCARAEAYGVLLYCNLFSAQKIRISTQSAPFAQRLPKLFQRAFQVPFDERPQPGETGKLRFSITRPESLARIMDTFGYAPEQSISHHINYAILEDDCCRAAFFRGAFLAGGSATDPEKRYHLELVTTHYFVDREAQNLMQEMGFEPKSVTRKANYVAYFKRSEAIADVLTTIGAPLAAMELMNAKVEKTLRSGVNRWSNCDVANLGKAVDAAQNQLEAIRCIQRGPGLESLPDKLRQTAQLRMDHPELSLAQLAALCDPPVSKSCLNHRLRKLAALAEGRE